MHYEVALPFRRTCRHVSPESVFIEELPAPFNLYVVHPVDAELRNILAEYLYEVIEKYVMGGRACTQHNRRARRRGQLKLSNEVKRTRIVVQENKNWLLN